MRAHNKYLKTGCDEDANMENRSDRMGPWNEKKNRKKYIKNELLFLPYMF